MTTRDKGVLAGIAALVVGLGGGYALGSNFPYDGSTGSNTVVTFTAPTDVAGITTEQFDLRLRLRELWAEHILWMGELTDALANNNTDNQANVTTRLTRNAEDIGNAISQYSTGVADTTNTAVTDLFRQHVAIMGDLLLGIKDNNVSAIDSAIARSRENASQIAAALSGINANLDRANIEAMMNEQVDLTRAEAEIVLQGRAGDHIAATDRTFDQAMQIADAIASGLTTAQTGQVETPTNVSPDLTDPTPQPGLGAPPPTDAVSPDTTDDDTTSPSPNGPLTPTPSPAPNDGGINY